jgi:hypothetical protein
VAPQPTIAKTAQPIVAKTLKPIAPVAPVAKSSPTHAPIFLIIKKGKFLKKKEKKMKKAAMKLGFGRGGAAGGGKA